MSVSTSIVNRNAAAAAQAALANDGYLRIYSGGKPATPETPASGDLLAELRFGTPAFGAITNGSTPAHALTPEASAPASGDAGWFRILAADATTPLWDGEVAASGADLNLDPVAILAGGQVEITSLTLILPQS